MKSYKSSITAIMLCLFATLLSACAGSGSVQGSRAVQGQHHDIPAGSALSMPIDRSRVALDLINALVQVEGFMPGDINVDVSRLLGPFGNSLKRVLAAKGYRSGATPSAGDVLVQFRARRGASVALTTVILSAGPIKLKRDYRLDEGGVQPASLMFILGAPADLIEPDDSIFVTGAAKTPATVPTLNIGASSQS